MTEVSVRKIVSPKSGNEIRFSSFHAVLAEFDGGISTDNHPHTITYSVNYIDT